LEHKVRFLVDAQLPPALVKFIRRSGHDCDHVADVGLRDDEDESIYSHAKENGCVIITKDEDFAQRKAVLRGKPQVVWLRRGNCSNRALIQWFEPLFAEVMERLDKGDDLVEVI
jgi:predicted nuclease of predicted toxin-antitoxin system